MAENPETQDFSLETYLTEAYSRYLDSPLFMEVNRFICEHWFEAYSAERLRQLLNISQPDRYQRYRNKIFRRIQVYVALLNFFNLPTRIGSHLIELEHAHLQRITELYKPKPSNENTDLVIRVHELAFTIFIIINDIRSKNPIFINYVHLMYNVLNDLRDPIMLYPLLATYFKVDDFRKIFELVCSSLALDQNEIYQWQLRYRYSRLSIPASSHNYSLPPRLNTIMGNEVPLI